MAPYFVLQGTYVAGSVTFGFSSGTAFHPSISRSSDHRAWAVHLPLRARYLLVLLFGRSSSVQRRAFCGRSTRTQQTFVEACGCGALSVFERSRSHIIFMPLHSYSNLAFPVFLFGVGSLLWVLKKTVDDVERDGRRMRERYLPKEVKKS